MEDFLNRFDKAFGRMLGKTAFAFRSQVSHELSETEIELSAEQAIILMNMWHLDGLSQQMIADFLHRDKTSTTRWIDVLEKCHLVVRVPDQQDRRQNMIHLTQEGRETCLKLAGVFARVHQKALKGVPQEDIDVCERVFDQIRTNLKATWLK